MKHGFTVGVAIVFLAATCAAQVHGVPASVNSPRSNGDFFTPTGIPAGVGSLGPQGYSRSAFNDRFTPTGPLRRDRMGRVVLPAPIPLFYGVPYYPVVYLPVRESEVVQRFVEPPTVATEPQKIILEIRDTRPAAVASKEAVPEKKAAPREEVEPPRVATVFIFQDGSRKELKDFAITPTELIDLSEGLIRRSPLASLDRAATVKANAENGVELHFPAASSD